MWSLRVSQGLCHKALLQRSFWPICHRCSPKPRSSSYPFKQHNTNASMHQCAGCITRTVPSLCNLRKGHRSKQWHLQVRVGVSKRGAPTQLCQRRRTSRYTFVKLRPSLTGDIGPQAKGETVVRGTLTHIEKHNQARVALEHRVS